MIKQNLRPDEAGEILGVSRRQIYRLIFDGEIVAFKVGTALRITAESLEAFKKRRIREFQEENGIYRDSV
jgi:excisionase family DNA binding protein